MWTPRRLGVGKLLAWQVGMALDEQNLALALIDEVVESVSPCSGHFTLLPPALPPDEHDLVGPSSDVLSLAALEAALDTLPFDEEPDPEEDVLIFLDINDLEVIDDVEDDGTPESQRPTRRYTVPDMPPCMRTTIRAQH